MRTYQDTLSYLYNRLPMFSRIGAAAYKHDLYNTIELCRRLDDPQKTLRCIHVAGTNGKGSTSHMLAAILQTAGYKTGLYTSPHLHDFRERIRVNGEMIAESAVIDFTERTSPWYDEIEPSFFEITVAMAFDHFAREKVDVAVIEVGLGGRLDSTNIIHPVLSVITNIGWDHMNILGDTLPLIAGEKAGIIKKDVPVVIGRTQEEIRKVFEEMASTTNSAIFFADQLWAIHSLKSNDTSLELSVQRESTLDALALVVDLPGIYQKENILTVLESVHQLRAAGWKINNEHIIQALKQSRLLTGLKGRWERIAQNPRIILDVGHNEDGIIKLLEQLKAMTYQQLHIVLGMVRDKDIDRVLRLLPKEAVYYFTQANIPRALEAEGLQQQSAGYGLQGGIYDDVNQAIAGAKEKANDDDLILVCGSVFLVGEVTRP